MYFGAVRKSGEILRDDLRTKHYAGIWGESQIANFSMADQSLWGDGGRIRIDHRGTETRREAAKNLRKGLCHRGTGSKRDPSLRSG
jgi:hypothetical protein